MFPPRLLQYPYSKSAKKSKSNLHKLATLQINSVKQVNRDPRESPGIPNTREKKEPLGKLAVEGPKVLQELKVLVENKGLWDHSESRERKVK